MEKQERKKIAEKIIIAIQETLKLESLKVSSHLNKYVKKHAKAIAKNLAKEILLQNKTLPKIIKRAIPVKAKSKQKVSKKPSLPAKKNVTLAKRKS